MEDFPTAAFDDFSNVDPTKATPGDFLSVVDIIYTHGATQAVCEFPEFSKYGGAMTDLEEAEAEHSRLAELAIKARERVQQLEADLRRLMEVEG
jgi:hypothetical protein